MKNDISDDSIISEISKTPEYKHGFYQNLLSKAIAELEGLTNPVMVCGPLHHGDKFDENCRTFQMYQALLRSAGHQVFDQLQYLDRYITGAPYDFDIKFKVFYKGIIASRKIVKFYFIPGWDQSRGAMTEKLYCNELGLPTEEFVATL